MSVFLGPVTQDDLTIDLATAVERLPDYKWYHRIELGDGVFTPDFWTNEGRPLDALWSAVLNEQRRFDFRGREVLDVGCRDGLFSFAAEQQGARRVVGIDNDVSKGARELLIPLFGSKVEMRQLNLYDLKPDMYGMFDVVLLYGVLYHLRYPVHGLRKLIDVIREGGLLLVESGMISDPRFDSLPLVYCPVDQGPYAPDWTSCTFFTEKGLTVTLESLGMVFDHSAPVPVPDPPPPMLRSVLDRPRPTLRSVLGRLRRAVAKPPSVPATTSAPATRRQFLAFHKDSTVAKPREYWESRHEIHTS